MATTKATAIGMSNAAAAARLEEEYAGSMPYQHGLEITRNGMQQPGTTDVCADIVKLPTSALKRVFINNGPALTESQLRTYMTTIGEGDGDIWRLDNTLGNRHAGARATTLPWTNIAVLSWDVEQIPGGLMMKLFKNPENADYEYTEPATPDPQLLAILTSRAEVQASGHGVAFIYLGRDEYIDGPFCDPNPNKGETENGIADALRDRIYAPRGVDGQAIKITINTPMPKKEGSGGRRLDGVTRSIRLDGRTIMGHIAWTNRPGAASGTVVVDDDLGVEIRWTLLPATDDPADRHLPYGGKGHIVCRYKNEAMVLAAPGNDYPDLGSRMRNFGIHLAPVYNRLSLEIIGPTDPGNDPTNPRLHLHQDPTRSKPMLSNGKELPLPEWGERFMDRMPREIVDANKAAREQVRGGKIQLSAADRLKARLGSRIKSVVQSRRRKAGTGVLGPSGAAGVDYPYGELNTSETLPAGTPSPTGNKGLTPGGSTKHRKRPNPRSGAKRRTTVTPKGTTNTRRRTPGSEKATDVQPRPAPMPEPKPFTGVEWQEMGLDPQYFVSWDHGDSCVYFNLGHPIMETQFGYFTGEWLEQNPRLRRRADVEDIKAAIFEAYAEDSISRIMHSVADCGLTEAKKQLTDAVLTIGARGFENVQAKIEDYIRKVASRGGIVGTEAAA